MMHWTRGNGSGLKLTEQVMRVLRRSVAGLIRHMVSIDDSHFGFVPGRDTTGAIFVIRQLQEKYLVKTVFDIQTVGKRGPGRPKITWKQLTERDCSEWKLSALNPYDSHTWRSGVRSAMFAASQLPGRGPTVVDIAPVPAPGLRSFKNGLECDYPRSTTERSEGPTERSEGVC